MTTRSGTAAPKSRVAARAGGARGPSPRRAASAIEPWADRAEAALAASGRKRGGARRALLELLERQSCALTALEIEETLRSQPRAVSRASVYRILEELERLHLVARVETGQAMARYERARDSEEHHHHLVCDCCGLVMPFSDDALERAIDELSGRVPLAVSEHEIVLRGACRACA
jgi:Fur family ferric uptake transcriptional regulator